MFTAKQDQSEWGIHFINSVVTNAFVKYIKVLGNNLVDSNPFMELPGLKTLNYWCQCDEPAVQNTK